MNGFLQDSQGNKSSSRLLMVAGTMAILAVWGVISVRTNAMAPIPSEVVAVIIALITGKVGSGALTEITGAFFKNGEQK